MNGFLCLDKPAGITSHDAVLALRRLTGQKKTGHAGTLDPLATGVLVLAFGAATKALPYLPDETKTYRAVAELGTSTDTQDRTGRIIESHDDCEIAHADLAGALAAMTGPSQQVPPMYSAVQVDGKRLYTLARAGIEVERAPRRIEIERLELDWPDSDSRPVLRSGDRFGFTVVCSRGTYVRTICHDLGKRLGCGAHLVELRRVASGPFHLDQAVPLTGLTREMVRENLIPIGRALAHLPALALTSAQADRVRHGGALPAMSAGAAGLALAFDPGGTAIAILEGRSDAWQPVRVFAQIE